MMFNPNVKFYFYIALQIIIYFYGFYFEKLKQLHLESDLRFIFIPRPLNIFYTFFTEKTFFVDLRSALL